MEYTKETIVTADGSEAVLITVYLNEQTAQTFPEDDNNPDYIAFLERLESEQNGT